MQRRAALVQYDPEWPRLFEAEQALLEPALRPWLDGGIHHAGSTAVPGLAAKPIIEMIAGVRDLEAARAAFEPLRALGYRYQEHRPEAHAFSKPESAADWWEQTHHLHLLSDPLELIDERPIERRRREERERTGEITLHRAVWPDPAAVLARRTGGVKVHVTDPDK